MVLLPAVLALTAPFGQVQAAPITPPPPATGPKSDVIVTARKPPERKVVEHLTRAITVIDPDDRIARFPDAVCPLVDGMPAAFAARMVARLREDAAAAAIPVAKPGCQPNIIVMFVPNGHDTVREIQRTRPYMFGDLEKGEIDRMIADTGPAHGWIATELRSRDNDRLRTGTMREDVQEIEVREASIIETATRQVITASILLIDQDAAVGKTLNQLADYAAMRTLAKVRVKGASGDTILTLFDAPAGEAPHELTGFDAGYLKALYHGPTMLRGSTKVGEMAREISAGGR